MQDLGIQHGTKTWPARFSCALVALTVCLMELGSRNAVAQSPAAFPLALAVNRSEGPFELLNLLTRQDVQQEIELIGDQLEQLRELRGKIRRRARERFAEIRIAGPQDARGRIQKLGVELRQEFEAELSKVLLPHQHRRLRQIRLQRQLRVANAAALLSADTMDQLMITTEQQTRLKERSKQLESQFQEKLRGMREEIRQQLLEVLTADQRQRLAQLTGESFDFRDDR